MVLGLTLLFGDGWNPQFSRGVDQKSYFLYLKQLAGTFIVYVMPKDGLRRIDKIRSFNLSLDLYSRIKLLCMR